MAFIDITTPKSPAGAAALLLQCKSGKRQFTPELCFDVLHATNFAKNMWDMLEMIAELPAEKQAAFKNVVLSTFEQRKQPNDVIILGKKLAISGGYEKEFNSVDKAGVAEGEYLLSGLGKRGLVLSKFDEKRDYSAFEEVLIASDRVYLDHMDLSKIKRLRFKDGAEVVFYAAKLPVDLDVSMCDKVDLKWCDLAPVKNLRFKEGAAVYLFATKNLPEELDVSMCDKVELHYCDLAQFKKLHFKQGAKVKLNEVRNVPETLDLSMCHVVKVFHCDLAQLKKLQFGKGAEVDLFEAKNLPERLDVSMCDWVGLFYCDLAAVKELAFQKGSKVKLLCAQNLPEKLDFSPCDEVLLGGCDLSNVKQLCFKNHAQRQNSAADIPYMVNVTYKNKFPLLSRLLGKSK